MMLTTERVCEVLVYNERSDRVYSRAKTLVEAAVEVFFHPNIEKYMFELDWVSSLAKT